MKTAKYFLLILFSIAAILGITACGDDPQVEPPLPDKVRRTVLVYQTASDTGLDNKSLDDLDEMLEAAADVPDDCRLLVYNDYKFDSPVLMRVLADGTLETIETYDNDALSIQSERMLDVFEDMEQHAPALQYGLILWGHGSGWLQDGIADTAPDRRRSYGGQSKKWMNITTLAETLECGPRFDFVYFDCCHMASVEVAYELRHATDFVAGSVMEIAGEGMPYDRTLKYFFTSGEADLSAAAETTIDYYQDWKETGSRPECYPPSFSGRYASITVVRTSALDALAAATAALYDAAQDTYPKGFTPQAYGRGTLKDYYFDFGQYAYALAFDNDGNDRFDGAAAAVKTYDDAMDAAIVYARTMDHGFGGFAMRHFSGLSTFIFNTDRTPDTKQYSELGWYTDVASKLADK